MKAVIEGMGDTVPVNKLCAALGFPRSTLYRLRHPAAATPAPLQEPCSSLRALSATEKTTVREVLNSERFADLTPRQVYGTLLDEGEYCCSISTMYCILGEQGEVNERRQQRTHPTYTRPELLATGPNQVWSWDITWLQGPGKWQHFYLYVILDIFSRYVVGWLLAEVEAADLAEQLIGETCRKQGIQRDQLTLHADRGAPMTAQAVAQLLEALGVTKRHPHTSDDNPFSEAQFKTLKYRPDSPERFESLADARQWVTAFFDWYNNEHRHSSLGLMTSAAVHWGLDHQLTLQRQQVLQTAYAAHPERFVKGLPKPPQVPEAAQIRRCRESPSCPATLPTSAHQWHGGLNLDSAPACRHDCPDRPDVLDRCHSASTNLAQPNSMEHHPNHPDRRRPRRKSRSVGW
jgi:putative transposase